MKQKQIGFTIIELLIVIVIIGVLVAITAIAYTGVTNNAKVAKKKSDIKQISRQFDIAAVKNEGKVNGGSYPGSGWNYSTHKLDIFNVPELDNDLNDKILYCQINEGLLCQDRQNVNSDYYIVILENTGDTYGSRYYAIAYWNDKEKLWRIEWFGDVHPSELEEVWGYINSTHLLMWEHNDYSGKYVPCNDPTFDTCG